MSRSWKKILMITLISSALICCLPVLAQAKTKEGAFNAKCAKANGYVIKSDQSTACPANYKQLNVEFLSSSLINIFCCSNTPENVIENGTETGDSPVEVMPLILNVKDLKQSDLRNINPLKKGSVLGEATPGFIIDRSLKTVIFPIAGILLFIFVILGGFQMIQASLTGKPNFIELGRNRVVAAIIGFILLFASYWLWMIVEMALGL